MRPYLALLLPLLAGCGSSSTDAPAAPTDSGVDASIDAPADTPVVTPAGNADVTLLTLTAWQGQLDPLVVSTATESTTYGGFATLSAYFKAERAKTTGDVLVVAGGDDFGASPVLSSVFDDEPAIKALDFLGLKATTFGNHNFDPGIAGLKKLIDAATFKFIATNLTNVTKELGTKVEVPYWMTEVGAAAPKPKVAFLGISAPSIATIQFPGKMGSIAIEEPIAAANKAAKSARDAGASLVVALVHAGADAVDAGGAPTGPIVDMVKGITGVDVFVADHTDLKFAATINGSLVVQNKKRGQGFSVINVKIADGKVTSKLAVNKDAIGTVTSLPPAGGACTVGTECASGTCTANKCVMSCPSTACPSGFTCGSGVCQKVVMAADAAADAVLAPYRSALPAKFDVKLTVVDQEYKRGGSPQIERIGETLLGDLVADAVLKRYATAPLNAKIAMINGGGLRNGLPSTYAPADTTLRRNVSGYASGPPYDIVVGDIYNLHPYGNAAVVRKIKGSVLWSALENGFASLPAAVGGFPQIAGFKVVYDPAAPSGSRVISVTLDDGAAIPKDDAKEYVLATVDFINAGGDGYSMLVETVPSQSLDALTTILIDYLKANSPLAAPTFGRLIKKT